MSPNLMFEIEDISGFPHTLNTYPIQFNNLQLGETKRVKAVLHNVGDITTDIKVQPIAHPTHQLGPADQTYGACLLSFTDIGPWVPILNVGTLSPNGTIDIYVQWSMPVTAIPGYAQFALKAEGVTNI